MRITVDPRRFTAVPLITKALARNDYSVLMDGLNAGRIMLQPRSSGQHVWLWTITGPILLHAGLHSSGEADTLEEARQALREAFVRWHNWALTCDVPVHWMA